MVSKTYESGAEIRKNRERLYSIDTSDSEVVVYVNWMYARNLRGLWWMIRNIGNIGQFLRGSDGLLDVFVSMQAPHKMLLVSYWRDHDALMGAFRDKSHIEMMKYVYKNPDDLILGNETYNAPYSTRYINANEGLSHPTLRQITT